MVRIGLQNGRLKAFAPQKLDDYGFLTCSTGKVQIVPVY